MSRQTKLASWQQLKNFGRATETIEVVELPVQKLVHEQPKVEVPIEPVEEKPVFQKLNKKSKLNDGVEG